MASSKWKSWAELHSLLAGKRLVFWGASNWIERAMEHGPFDAAYIVDNSPLNQGTTYCGLPVVSPQRLDEESRNDIYVVITTGNYASVIEELHAKGFVMGDQFCCCPLLNERRHVDELISHRATVLLASPEHFADATHGGGIYRYTTGDFGVQKVYTGKCRGITAANGRYFIVDMLRGVVILDQDFAELGLVELSPNAEPHGLHVDTVSNRLFVATPGRDSVSIYDLADNKQLEEIFISDKWSNNGRDNHHVNDLTISGDSLFVSLFSFSGNWGHDCFDGGVLEVDLGTRTVRGPVVSNLWMPHSVKLVQGKLTYLDSMHATLNNTTHSTLGEFNGFIRGLDFDGRYYFVGVSRHRYPERLAGSSKNISLDTGFFLFDPQTHMSRFFGLNVTETIHSLIVVPTEQSRND